jgi:hypothetical protein
MGQLTMEFYLKRLKSRYMRGDRKVKSAILDEYCKTSGCHRKHATRLFTRMTIGWRDKPAGRKKTYQPEDLREPLKQLWFATDQLCGRRLKVAIPLWMPYYEALYGTLEPGIKQHLLSASSATLDRLLKPCRSRYPKRLSGTRPGSLLRQQIPIKTNQWNEDRPGFVEADTVAHCGMSLAGNFVWSVTLTDIYSGWTENRATWNKGSHGVFAQLESIEKALPFIILGFDSDNGGEFLNFHLMKYFLERDHPVQFTRSRPYHSGDDISDGNAPVRACYPYIKNRPYQLDYKTAIANDLPIGSGEIESTHRYIIQKRLKIAGSWWLEETAENRLALRVNRANHQWDGYWENKAA